MTLAILSWSARKTLRNTLESYKFFGLDTQFEDKVIYFQEIHPEDIAIAYRYGYRYIGSKENVGIAKAYAALVENAKDEHFLFLENDWVQIEPTLDRINACKAFLDTGLDVVRLRHRSNPGYPLWTLQFKGDEYERPTHLLDSVHWTDASKFTEIDKMDTESGTLFFTTSRNANWTNNPTMFRTEWLKKYILPRVGNRDIEVDLQEWWEQQDFRVGYLDPGLFTHRRIG